MKSNEKSTYYYAKRLVYCLLILFVLLSCLTLSCAAEEALPTITWGTYEQDDNLDNGSEPIEWIVLDGNQEDGWLLLSKYILSYGNSDVDISFDHTEWNCESVQLSSSLVKQYLPEPSMRICTSTAHAMTIGKKCEETMTYSAHGHVYHKDMLTDCWQLSDASYYAVRENGEIMSFWGNRNTIILGQRKAVKIEKKEVIKNYELDLCTTTDRSSKINSLIWCEGNFMVPEDYEHTGVFYLRFEADGKQGQSVSFNLPKGFSFSKDTTHDSDRTVTRRYVEGGLNIPIYSVYSSQSVSSVSFTALIEGEEYTLSIPVTAGNRRIIWPSDRNISDNYKYVDVIPDNWAKECVNGIPTEYSQNFADIAVKLSFSIYDNQYVCQSLYNLGFNNVYYCPFGDWEYGCDFCIGRKTMVDSEGNNFNLLAVVIRGTIGEEEWIGNFIVGDGENADGFDETGQQVKRQIENYLKDAGIFNRKENTCFFICGHSRGAAVANNIAHSLIAENSYLGVVGYTFATPNTTRNPASSDSIYNFKYANDVVCYAPQTYFNHGKTYVIGSSENVPDDVESEYERYTSRDYEAVNQDVLIGGLITAGRKGNAFLSNGIEVVAGKLFNFNVKHHVFVNNAHSGENYVSWVTKNKRNNSKTYAEVLSAQLTRLTESSRLLAVKASPIGWFTATIINAHTRSLFENAIYKSFFAISVHCPVDVQLISGDGTIAASFVNHSVQFYNEDAIFAISEDDMDYLVFPADSGYHLAIIGNGEGTMDIEMLRIADDLTTSEVESIVNIPVNNTSSYSFTLKNDCRGFGELVSGDGKIYTSEIELSDIFTLPNSTQIISSEAFFGIVAETVYIPASVEQIGSKAFANCPKLKRIVFANGDLDVAEDFISGCPADLVIRAPEGSTVANKINIYRAYLGSTGTVVDPVDAGDEEIVFQ